MNRQVLIGRVVMRQSWQVGRALCARRGGFRCIGTRPAFSRFVTDAFRRVFLPVLLAAAVLPASGAEIKFDFGQFQTGRLPDGFVSLVSGPGRPGDWKVMDVPAPRVMSSLLTNLSGPMTATAKRTVLAASSPDAAPGHCPLLLYTNETFANFTLTTRFKIVSGSTAPEAGIAFRVQDESNYYVLRASTLGNLLWYRVVRGVRYEGQGIGVQIPIARDEWQELRLECSGNSFRGFLNGKLLIPPVRDGAPTNNVAINDSTFAAGKTGFWTAGDTAACFVDTTIEYTARVPLIKTVIAGVMKKNPRLLGLKVYAPKNSPTPVVVADGKDADLGTAGTKTEEDVMASGRTYLLRQSGSVEVTQPLRDRNGEVVAVLKTTMNSFRGETTDNAVARATQIKLAVESGLANAENINE